MVLLLGFVLNNQDIEYVKILKSTFLLQNLSNACSQHAKAFPVSCSAQKVLFKSTTNAKIIQSNKKKEKPFLNSPFDFLRR
ncbi:hypothetical protein AB669_01225 [Pedobacter sp. BMA]|nr:hypothetical protein AB669_01225 [Pedobacter sp. BMA]